MGGLALRHLNVQRIPADRYQELSIAVHQRFKMLFGVYPNVIPAYAQKPDFGDCDMLITSAELPADWREQLAAASNSRGWLINGDVTSMEVENVQFDFISVPREAREFAYVYFAFNDLGNLMGRVANAMGFKYGHLGLQYALRDGSHVYATLNVTNDIAEAFYFMGYDYALWQQGFQTLEEIFQFTASSYYFNSDIYLMHNRNAVGRIRDAKRKTYTEFLKWCTTTKELNAWPWYLEDKELRAANREFHLDRARKRWSGFASRMDVLLADRQNSLDIKTRWNGNNVSSWTGLSGKQLGQFMRIAKEHPDFQSHVTGDLQNLKSFVIDLAKNERKDSFPVYGSI